MRKDKMSRKETWKNFFIHGACRNTEGKTQSNGTNYILKNDHKVTTTPLKQLNIITAITKGFYLLRDCSIRLHLSYLTNWQLGILVCDHKLFFSVVLAGVFLKFPSASSIYAKLGNHVLTDA